MENIPPNAEVSSSDVAGPALADLLKQGKTERKNWDGRQSGEFLSCVFAALHKLAATLTIDDTKMTGGSTPILSVQDEATIRSLLELIILQELTPHLLPGVGIDLLSQRKEIVPSSSSPSSSLKWLLLSFLSLLHNSTELRLLVLQRFLVHLLAASLQLAFSPPSTVIPPSLNPSTSFPSKLPDFEPLSDSPLAMEERTLFASYADLLLLSVSVGTAIETLMALLSRPGCPTWMRRESSSRLSLSLTRAGGVRVLLERLLNTEKAECAINKAIDQAAIAISSPSIPDKQAYYDAVSPQLLSLLDADKESHKLVMAAAAGIYKLSEKVPSVAKEKLFSPLLAPFTPSPSPSLSSLSSSSQASLRLDSLRREIVLSESEVLGSLTRIHHIIELSAGSSSVRAALDEVLVPLFRLYCLTLSSKSNLHTLTRDTLVKFLAYHSNTRPFLLSLLTQEPSSPSSRSLSQGSSFVLSRSLSSIAYYFAAGESGGAVMVKGERETDLNAVAEAFVQLLKDLNDVSLSGDIFVDLLSRFTAHLSQLTEDRDEDFSLPSSSVLSLQVLAFMTESLDTSLLSSLDLVQVCTLLRTLLEQPSENTEVLTLALGILSVLLNGGTVKLGRDQDFLLFDLLPALESLCEHGNDELRTMAVEISILIQTKKGSWHTGSDYTETSKAEDKNSQKKEDKNEAEEAAFDLDGILKDLADSSPPIRAYGIVCLRKAVLSRSPSATNNVARIFNLLSTQLKDDDSYVYGNASKALASLGDIFPDRVLPLLVTAYNNTSAPDTTRLKIGESLLQITRRSGEVLPKYAPIFMNLFLRTTKDKSASVRASSLSNLAQLSKQLRFALHPYITELLECVFSLLSTDKDEEVRRGSVYVLLLLLRGMGTDVFELVPEQLKKIYRALKITVERDPDEITRENASFALVVLEDIIKQLFELPPPSHSPLIQVIK